MSADGAGDPYRQWNGQQWFGWDGRAWQPEQATIPVPAAGSGPADPGLHWDGRRWLRWDGASWVPAVTPAPAPVTDQPEVEYPARLDRRHRSAGPGWTTRRKGLTVVGTAVAGLLVLGGIGNALTGTPAATPAPSATSVAHTSTPSGTPLVSASTSSPASPATVTASPAPTVVALTSAPALGAAGAYLPARAVTPGAINPTVTEATISSTICRSGFTAAIRPPVDYTDALKIAQLASGYAVHGIADPRAYEEDHLIPLELGGSPTSIKNLWPEPWEQSSAHPYGFAKVGTGAQTKDRIEDSLRTRVCDHRITLAAAQQMIAANWRAAFDTYIGSPGPTKAPVVTVHRTPTPKPTSGGLQIVHPGAFCSPPGAHGITTAGTLMVCKLDSKGLRYRWGKA